MPSRQLGIWQSLKFERVLDSHGNLEVIDIYMAFKSKYHMICGI